MANPYFQPVIDLIATHPAPSGNLDLVLKLCEAVEAEHTAEISLLTVRVVKNVSPEKFPAVLIPEEVWYETMARLLLLAEQSNLQLLLDWYERPTTFARTRKDEITEHWQGLLKFITLPAPGLTEKELDELLARIVAALKIVLGEYVLATAEEGKVKVIVPDPSLGELSPGSFGGAPSGPPRRSVVLADGIRRLVQSWMAVHQQFLDAAWAQLGAGGKDRGDKLLRLSDRWLAAVNATLFNPRFNETGQGRQIKLGPWSQIEIPLGKIRYGRSRHHDYLDAFPVHDSRVFGFTSYDRDPPDEPPGKTVLLVDLVRYRGAQLYFLLDEFGEYYPPVPPPSTFTERADELARKLRYAFRRKIMDAVVKRGGSLKLESEDDLVSFGCAFYEVVSAASSAQQASTAYGPEFWNILLDIFALHLRTHTIHSEFNMDESPSFFDRLFPRAINGGVWHDCAVYAVRLAFVFFSLAHCMKSVEYPNPPKISFIMFPLHVGLIVELDGMLPIVIHNEILFRMTDEQMQAAKDEWIQSPEPGDPKDSEKLDQKFIEDLAAQMLLRDVNLPLLRVPIAPVSAPVKKAEIWKAFQRLVVKNIDRLLSPVIESSSSPFFQFDTRFLFEITREKRWHDNNVVPFWNDGCFQLWRKHQPILSKNPSKKDDYIKGLEALLKTVEESYDKEIRAKKSEFNDEFAAAVKKGVLGKEAQRVTVTKRLEGFAKFLGPVGQVKEHLEAVKNATGPIPEPPFATQASLLSRHGE